MTAYVNHRLDRVHCQELGAKPIFSTNIYDREAWDIDELERDAAVMANDLIAAFAKEQGSFPDIIIVPTCNQAIALVLEKFIKQHAPNPRPQILLGLLLPPCPPRPMEDPQQKLQEAEYSYAFQRLRRAMGRDENFWVFSETERLVKLYTELTGLPVALYQGPTLDQSLKPKQWLYEPGRLTVVCAGHGNPMKGYHLLPAVIDIVCSRSNKIAFKIHASERFSGENLKADFAAIRSRHPDVEINTGDLEPSDYFDWLRAADIILVPYDPLIYRNRGSGLYTEAEILGIPTVAPAECDFSRAGIESGRTVAINAFDSQSVADAVLVAADNFYQLREASAKFAAELYNRQQKYVPIELVLSCASRLQNIAKKNYGHLGKKNNRPRFSARRILNLWKYSKPKPAVAETPREPPVEVKPAAQGLFAGLYENPGLESTPSSEVKIRYIVAAMQRTGSNLLIRELLLAGAGMPGEYFSHLAKLDARTLSDERYWNFLLSKRSMNGVFGVKLHKSHYDDLTQQQQQRVFASSRVIFTRRRSLALQALSYEKAETTGIWDPRWQPDLATPGADYTNLKLLIRRAHEIVADENFWMKVFAFHGIQPLTVFLEDYLLERESTLARVFDFLGIRAAVPEAEPAPVGKLLATFEERELLLKLEASIVKLQKKRLE